MSFIPLQAIPLRVQYTSEAGADIEEIGLYFFLRAPEVEARFYRALDKTVRVLARSPNLGECHPCRNPKLEGMRKWQVDGFPNHMIFYRPAEDKLEILRVLHGARDYAAILNEE
jgi:toxin ParE1/3/4